jgi:hypothetical protein
VEELEEKGQTILTKRTPIQKSSEQQTLMCAVDGCLHPARVSCEVTVSNHHLGPETETHLVSLCDTHANAFNTLKWEWRRKANDAAIPRLMLDAIFAADTIED